MTPTAFDDHRSRWPSRLVLLGTLAAILNPGVIAARQADTTQSDSTRAHMLRRIIITASQVPLTQREIGFATSVLGMADLTAEPVVYAAEALARLPGVWIDQGVGPGGPTVLRLRGGEEPYTQVMFDGVALNISGGFFDMQGLTLTNVERVEVARGPQSALHGSSAIAGAVQFITRRGRVGRPTVRFSAEGGRATEHGQQARTEFTVSGGSPSIRYSSGVGVTYNRGVYDLAHDLRTTDASVRLDATPAPAWTFTGLFRYMDIESQLPVRDPGVTRAPLDPNQRDTRDRIISSLAAVFDASSSWRHTLTASVFRDDFLYVDEADGLDPATFPFFVFDFNFNLRSILRRGSLKYVGTNDFSFDGSSTLSVSYGGQLEREDLSDEQGGDFGDAVTEFDRTNRALFTDVHARIGSRLSILVGARLEKYRGLPTQLVPRASAVLTIVPDWLSLRAAVGQAFKAPNLQQQFLENPFTDPNPDLEPETSFSWEGGITVGTPDGSTTLGLGFFHQRHTNLIRTVPIEGSTKLTNQNLGESRAVGVEVEFERQWSVQWRTGLNATWIDTEVIDNAGLPPGQFPEGSDLLAIPSVTGTAFAEAALTDAVTVIGRASVVGEQTVFSERFSGERTKLDAYALFSLTVRVRANSGLEFYSRINNLFNEPYQTAFDRSGQPLSAAVGVRITN